MLKNSSYHGKISVFTPCSQTSRLILNGRNISSGGFPLADVGATTAMFSGSSSAASLPVLTVESLDLAKNPPRRRQVYLKTTTRKESLPECEKVYVHTGLRSMTEVERKRFVGVWASNHCQDAHVIPSNEESFLDSLVIPKL